MSTHTASAASKPVLLRRADARRAGISLQDLRGRAYQRVFFDAYVPSGILITPALRARVALGLLSQAAHVSHHTAVQMWGGVAPYSADTHVTVRDRVHRTRREGIAAHYDPVPRPTTLRQGVLVSTPTQAFLELAAAGVPLVDLVVAGDSLVKATDSTPQSFLEAAHEWSGRNARLARRAARLIRFGVDSAMESRLRLLIVLSGLPEPEVNVVLRGPDGEWAFRFDLC